MFSLDYMAVAQSYKESVYIYDTFHRNVIALKTENESQFPRKGKELNCRVKFVGYNLLLCYIIKAILSNTRLEQIIVENCADREDLFNNTNSNLLTRVMYTSRLFPNTVISFL